MGRESDPKFMKLAIKNDWKGYWFADATKKSIPNSYANFIKNDILLDRYFKFNKELRFLVLDFKIERNFNVATKIILFCVSESSILGKSASKLEKMKKEIEQILHEKIHFEIKSVKNPFANPNYIASYIAENLEKRKPYKKIIRSILVSINKAGTVQSIHDKSYVSKTIAGIIIKISGRINGSEIARSESFRSGSMPTRTLRADVSLGRAEAHTIYGVIGIKVFVYLKPFRKR